MTDHQGKDKNALHQSINYADDAKNVKSFDAKVRIQTKDQGTYLDGLFGAEPPKREPQTAGEPVVLTPDYEHEPSINLDIIDNP